MVVAEVNLAVIIRTTRAEPVTTLALVGKCLWGLTTVVQANVSALGLPSPQLRPT